MARTKKRPNDSVSEGTEANKRPNLGDEEPQSSKRRVELDAEGASTGPNTADFTKEIRRLALNNYPITCKNFKAMPKDLKNGIWEEIKKTYDIDESYKIKAIKRSGSVWKQFKKTLRLNHIRGKPVGSSINTPVEFPQLKDDWAEFVQQSQDKNFQNLSNTFKAIRKKNEDPHRLGRGGYKTLKKKLVTVLAKKGESADSLTRDTLWIEARKDSKGQIITDATKAKAEKIAEVKERRNRDGTISNIKERDDVLTEVLGKEYGGRVRAGGQFDTITKHWGRAATKPVTSKRKGKSVDMGVSADNQAAHDNEIAKLGEDYEARLLASMDESALQNALIAEMSDSLRSQQLQTETLTAECEYLKKQLEISNCDLQEATHSKASHETEIEQMSCAHAIELTDLALEIEKLNGIINLAEKDVQTAVGESTRQEALLASHQVELSNMRKAHERQLHDMKRVHLLEVNDLTSKLQKSKEELEKSRYEAEKAVGEVALQEASHKQQLERQNILLEKAKSERHHPLPSLEASQFRTLSDFQKYWKELKELIVVIETKEDQTFGTTLCSAYFTQDDIDDIVKVGEISTHWIVLYLRHMSQYLMSRNLESTYLFANPNFAVGYNSEDFASHITKQILNVKGDGLLFCPCNTMANHWILLVFRPLHRTVYLCDSKNAGLGARQNIVDAVNRVWQTFNPTSPKWVEVRVPEQPSNVECGYCVMMYIRDIIRSNTSDVHRVYRVRKEHSTLK